MSGHGRASFAPEDSDDAKRGHPDVDLRAYADQRGLEFLDHATPGGYRAAVPCDPERQFNVVRGTLPGGEYGVMAHENLALEWTENRTSWSGGLYNTRVKAKGGMGWGGFALNVATGGLLGGETATALVRVPCTVAAVRVPELLTIRPRLRICTRKTTSPWTFGNRVKLDDALGISGWSLFSSDPEVPADVVRELVDEPVKTLLRAHGGDALFQVVSWWGTLVLRRNGFLPESAFDELGEQVSLLAGALREVGLRHADPLPFGTELPAPSRTLDEPWGSWAADTAARLGLTLEDPMAYHRAFPSIPVPGQADVVMRGDLPGGAGPGRLVVHREGKDVRPALVVEAPPGTDVPVGGVIDRDHGVRRDAAGDMLAAWDMASYWGNVMAGDIDEFCIRATAGLR